MTKAGEDRRLGWRVPVALVPIAILLLGGVWLFQFLSSSPSEAEAASSAGEAPSLTTVDSVVTAARNYLNTGDTQQATMILERATEKYPGESVLHAMLGEARYASGDLEGALASFEFSSHLGPDQPAWRDFAGAIAAELQNWEKSAAHYGMAQQLDPTNPKFPLYRAQAQRALGDVDAARFSLVRATNLDPSISEAWASLAAISLDENHSDLALQHIAKARKLQPDNPVYRIMEARALRREGRAEEAANILYAIPEETRLASPQILSDLALCLGMLGEREAAAEMYIRAAEATPADPEIAFQTAMWLERVDRDDEAAPYARRAAYLGHEGAKEWCRQHNVPM